MGTISPLKIKKNTFLNANMKTTSLLKIKSVAYSSQGNHTGQLDYEYIIK